MKDAELYNGTVLAYVGDAVIELFVRQKLRSTGISDTGRLSALALRFVTATAQSEAFGIAEEMLTEEELDIYRRGRNAAVSHHPKHQKMTDYRRATGFEALMGYLHLTGNGKRAYEIFEKAYGKVIGNIDFTE